MTFQFTATHSGLLDFGNFALENTRLFLASNILTPDRTWEQILATEAIGYSRPLLTFDSGTIVTNTAVFTATPVEISPDISISFNAIALVQNAGETPTKPVESMLSSNNQITATNHGLLADDPIMFTGLGILAEPLAVDVMYYVKTVIDPNSFTVTNEPGGSTISLTTNSEGLIDMRYGNGNCILFTNIDTTQTILAGQTYSFTIENITFN
jgi:hypothetical protein